MIFFIIPEIRYGIGLIEQSSEPMTIVTSNHHQAIHHLRKRGQQIVCLAELGINPWLEAHQILSEPAIQSLIQALPPRERKLITFKISPRFEFVAKQLEATILMPASQLNRFWEDKNKGMAVLAAVGVPVKQSWSGLFQDQTYTAMVAQLGCASLVVQKPRGMAGNSTYFVHSEAEWEHLADQIGTNPLVKISPYYQGQPYTVNCVLNTTGCYHSYPMYQITGDRRFTRYPGGTCGIDMTGARQFSHQFLEKLTQIVQLIGHELEKSGFCGWFGLDFLVDAADEVTIIEINPRFTASISLFSQAQYQAFGASFWQIVLDQTLAKQIAVQPLPYTSLILRNVSDDDMVIGHQFASGIYAETNGHFALVKQTVWLADLESAQHYLVVAKDAGTGISRDGEYATIVAYRSTINHEGQLDEQFGKVADFVSMSLLR